MKNPEGENLDWLTKQNIDRTPEITRFRNRLKSEGNESWRDKEEQIKTYLSRLDEFFNTGDGQEKEKKRLKYRDLLARYIITKKENIPQKHFQTQAEIQEKRGLGKVEFSKEEIEKEKENIIENQKTRFYDWFDYLTEEDSTYTTDFKYFAMRGLSKMGDLQIIEDKEDPDNISKREYKFAKRKPYTTSSLPELDREALANVYSAINAIHKGKEVETNVSEEMLGLVKQNAPFAKLYAQRLKELDQLEEGKNLKETKGEWRLYKQNSEPEELLSDLEAKRSHLCIAESAHAKNYLGRGDMWVYYSSDRTGETSTPRVAIATNNAGVYEIRGTWNSNEDIDPYMLETDILNEKLKELPQGEKYLKKHKDMKRLTEISNRIKEDANTTLTKQDLTFLYEIEGEIEGFGYQKDPRIQEIRENRDLKEDLPILFDCTSEEIATNTEEVNENIKVYVGRWDVDVYNIVRDYPNIKHLYEKFPDKEIFVKTLETDPSIDSPEKVKKVLKDKGTSVLKYAEDLLDKTEFSKEKQTYELVQFTVEQLGFTGGATTEEIYTKAKEKGLELCPAEVGPHLRLSYEGTDWKLIAMDQITVRGGDPSVFFLDADGAGLSLDGHIASPVRRWHGRNQFVFLSRK